MSNVQLSVNLNANVSGFINSMQQASTASAGTENAVSTLSTNISRNIANVNRQNLSQFTAALNAGTLSINRFNNTPITPPVIPPLNTRPLVTGANQASFALTNLGRVAQDAPFGFIGIQNNLNPLLESFQRLRAETGSNRLALRALGQSLIGPAGLGLALSAISAAVLFYQQYQQRANKATQEAKKVTDEYLKSLDAVTAARLKGGQNAQKEITDLNLLYNAYQNSNLSLKTRKSAYKELQDQYPGYFGNLKFEREASEKTKKAYDELSQAILATGRARAASDKIAENQKRRLENEQKIADLEKNQIKSINDFGKAQAKVDQQNLAARFEANMLTSEQLKTLNSANNALGNAQKIQKSINNLKTDNNKLDEQNNRLVTSVNTELEKGATLTGSIGGKLATAVKKLSGSLKEITGPENTGILDRLVGTSFNPELAIKPLQKFVSASEEALNKLRYEYNYTDDQILDFANRYNVSTERLLQITENLNKSMSDIINNGIGSTISGLAESIGNSIATGANVAEAAGQSLLSSLGGVLVQLGELAIATGIGIKAIQTALKSLNPVVAIAAGVALVALGSIFKAKANALGGGQSSGGQQKVPQIRGFATGGNVLPGGMALVGERGPELVNLPTGASVSNNTKTNRILSGGSQANVVINGNLEVGLDKLYIALQKTGKKLERQGR